VPALFAVSSGIGRGHPGYLESVLAELKATGVTVPLRRAGGLGWRLARAGYALGAQGGLWSSAYNRLRSSSRPSPLQLALLDAGLRRRLSGCAGTVIVDHPLLAHLLAPVCRTAFLHAEIAAPPVCAVPEAWRTFVPLDFTARQLQTHGVKPEALNITGLVIEPALVPIAESAFSARLARLTSSDARLTVAFFTSGAYPRAHLDAIAVAARSVVAAGHQQDIYSGTCRALAARLRSATPAQVVDSD